MDGQDNKVDPGAERRRRAEAMAREKGVTVPDDIELLSLDRIKKTLHELRVHQIELEMQNEELRRAQAELDAARARYFDLYDLAPVGYGIVSESGLIEEANLTLATMLGVARGALAKQPISPFICKEDQDAYYSLRKQLFASGEPQSLDLRMMKRDGAVFSTFLEATIAKGDDGVRVCRLSVSDITNLKKAESATRVSEEYLSRIIDAVADPIFVKDREHRWVLVNAAFCAFMGRTAEVLRGKSDYEFFPKEEAAVFWSKDEDVFRAGGENVNEEFFTDGKGVRRTIVTKKTLYKNEEGREYIVGIIRDITERKQLEERLQEKMAQVENMNKFMVNRELRVIEMKKEVNSLCKELGRPEPYSGGVS